MTKVEDLDRILNASRSEKKLEYKKTPIRFRIDLSNETLQVKRTTGYIVLKKSIKLTLHEEKSIELV